MRVDLRSCSGAAGGGRAPKTGSNPVAPATPWLPALPSTADPPIGEPLVEPLQVDLHDPAELLGAERVEEHDFVEPVQEPGLERATYHTHDGIPLGLGIQRLSARNCEPRLEVKINKVPCSQPYAPGRRSADRHPALEQMSKTSVRAFSTSSSSTTEYGGAERPQ